MVIFALLKKINPNHINPKRILQIYIFKNQLLAAPYKKFFINKMKLLKVQ